MNAGAGKQWHLLYSPHQQAAHIELAKETASKPATGYHIIGAYSSYEAALEDYQQFFQINKILWKDRY